MRTLYFALILSATATASAQVSISSHIEGSAYDPAGVTSDVVYSNSADWDAAGRVLEHTAHAIGYPGDGPNNLIDGRSRFEQYSYGHGTIRAKSVAFGSGFSVGSPRFVMNTLFQGDYHLEMGNQLTGLQVTPIDAVPEPTAFIFG